VQKALAKFKGYHIYPDAAQVAIRRSLAQYTGVPAEQIVAGSGSDQLIDLLIRLFCAPGDEIINLPPTFAMFKFYGELQGAKVVSVPRDGSYHIDIPGVKKAVTSRTKLIFIANPNNPTGTLIPAADVSEVLELGLPTVVDEAYYEFTGQTFAPRVGDTPNLMVLRTFSKWAGLAGLRAGYGIFPAAVAELLGKVKMPYNVSVAAQVAMLASLEDIALLRERVGLIVRERERLIGELAAIPGLRPFPSEANFILCRIENRDARDVWQCLRRQGIFVRYFDEPMVRDCIRISVGRPEDSQRLLAALREICLAG